MPKGTILYLGGFELPDKNAAAHRVLSNGKALRELGYTVVFIDVDKALAQGADILATKKDVQGFSCYSQAYPKSKQQWFNYLTDIRLFQKVFAQYTDVKAVICYNYQAIALRKLLIFCHNHGVKVLADCTEWYSARGNSLSFFLLKGFDTWYRMRVLQKKLDGLIVISSYLADYYRASPHVVQVPPLVDLSEAKWQTSGWTHTGVPHLVYAGSPGTKDQIQFLVEALSHSSAPYHLDIIGITKAQYLEQFPSHAHLLEVKAEEIRFLGRLGHLETLSYVQAADYSCFFRENTRVTRAGFPTKFVESISCGTPVLTNQSSNLMDYMQTGAYGVCLEELTRSSIEKGLSMCLTQGQPLPADISSCFDYRNYIAIFQTFTEELM